MVNIYHLNPEIGMLKNTWKTQYYNYKHLCHVLVNINSCIINVPFEMVMFERHNNFIT